MKIITIGMIIISLSQSLNSHAQDWELLEQIAPSTAQSSDYGANMVFAEDMLVVSWPRLFTNNEAADSCGEIITYKKDANNKYQEISRLSAQILTGTCKIGDSFGESLSYDDGRLAIGMPAGQRKGWGFSGNAVDTESRVFITHFANNNWQLDETIIADDLVDGANGMAGKIHLEGNILLVQGNTYNTIYGFSFSVSNAVYVFEESGNGFQFSGKLTESVHLFGQAFDFENNQIVVGSFGEQNISTAGRVDIYEKSSESWVNRQTIQDQRNINLGTDVSILNDTMALGGVHAGGKGGVVIYQKQESGNWVETQYVQASNAHDNDQFGFETELFADELVVGAPMGESPNTEHGAVFIFKKQADGIFVEQQKLVSNNSAAAADNFGGNVLFNTTDLLVNSLGGGLGGGPTSYYHYSRENTGGSSDYNVNAKVSGTYTSNAENQGVSLEILQDGRAVLFASLNNNNENLWLFATGTVSNNNIDFEHVYKTDGASFGSQFDAGDVNVYEIGQAMMSFSTCKTATLSYDFATLATGEISLNKSLEIPGNECDNSNKALPNGVSGAWFDRSRSGEGFSNYLYEENGVQMAKITWFTYDNDGKQMWLSGTGTVNNKTISISAMKQYTGASLFSGTTQNKQVGSLSMTWNDCHNATIDYDFTMSNLGSGALSLSQLTVLDNTQCDLK